MKHLKILSFAVLCTVLVLGCQSNGTQKQVAQLTEEGWEITHHWGANIPPGSDLSKLAADKFEQAVSLDSSYAPALAGLALHYIPAKYQELGREAAVRKAKLLARRAVESDPGCAPAYVARGRVEIDEGDISAAKISFEKALALDPLNVDALRQYSEMERWSEGDYTKALELAKKAVEADPENSIAKWTLAKAYRYLGRLDEALAWNDKAFEDYKAGIFFIEKGTILYVKGEYDAAINISNEGLTYYPGREALKIWLANSYLKNKNYEKAIPLYQELNQQWFLGWAYGLMGEKEKAQEILAALKQKAEQGSEDTWGMACVYLGLADKENAITYFDKSMEKAITNHWFGDYKYFITTWTDIQVLHAHPRFQALLEKVNSYQVGT